MQSYEETFEDTKVDKKIKKTEKTFNGPKNTTPTSND